MVTIVKIGGSLHSKGLSKNLFEDIKNFSKTESLIVVHGGGNTVTDIAEKLGKKQKDELRELDKEVSVLAPRFSKNVLGATNEFELWITEGRELDGLPETAIVQAKEAAVENGRDDAWLITLQSPSYSPFMKYARSQNLRKELCNAKFKMCIDGEFNNLENIRKIIRCIIIN